MSEPHLRISNFAVQAGERRLVEGLDVAVEHGELVALYGPSGAGKTSLLRAIAYLNDPEEGEIRLGGRSPQDIGWPAYRRRVVFVHQRPVMLSATVEENLRRPLLHHAVRAEFDRDLVVTLLDECDLRADCLDQHAPTLSIGEQQRIAMIRALLVATDILLLDEPTSALDADARAAVEVLIERESRSRGRSALIVSHDGAQAKRLCDRQIDLRPYLAQRRDRDG